MNSTTDVSWTERLNLVQLRTELKKIGLSPTGLKAVLVDRLKNAYLANPSLIVPAYVFELPLPSSPIGLSSGQLAEAKDKSLLGHRAVRRKGVSRSKHIVAEFPPLESDDEKFSESELSEEEEDEEMLEERQQEEQNALEEQADELRRINESFKRKRTSSTSRHTGATAFAVAAADSTNKRRSARSEGDKRSQQFLQHAAAELFRMKDQQRFQKEMDKMQDQIDELKDSLEGKNRIIASLQESLQEKEKIISNLCNVSSTVPRELLINWLAMQRLLT